MRRKINEAAENINCLFQSPQCAYVGRESEPVEGKSKWGTSAKGVGCQGPQCERRWALWDGADMHGIGFLRSHVSDGGKGVGRTTGRGLPILLSWVWVCGIVRNDRHLLDRMQGRELHVARRSYSPSRTHRMLRRIPSSSVMTGA